MPTMRIPRTNRKDEIGEMAAALIEFKARLKENQSKLQTENERSRALLEVAQSAERANQNFGKYES